MSFSFINLCSDKKVPLAKCILKKEYLYCIPYTPIPSPKFRITNPQFQGYLPPISGVPFRPKHSALKQR